MGKDPCKRQTGGLETYGIKWSLGKPHAIQASPSLGRGRLKGPPLRLRELAWQAPSWEGGYTGSPGRHLPVPQLARAVLASRCFQALPAAKRAK